MPAKTEKQRKAAGAELGRRKSGAKPQSKATRPFGSATTKQVKDYARKGKR